MKKIPKYVWYIFAGIGAFIAYQFFKGNSSPKGLANSTAPNPANIDASAANAVDPFLPTLASESTAGYSGQGPDFGAAFAATQVAALQKQFNRSRVNHSTSPTELKRLFSN